MSDVERLDKQQEKFELRMQKFENKLNGTDIKLERNNILTEQNTSVMVELKETLKEVSTTMQDISASTRVLASELDGVKDSVIEIKEDNKAIHKDLGDFKKETDIRFNLDEKASLNFIKKNWFSIVGIVMVIGVVMYEVTGRIGF